MDNLISNIQNQLSNSSQSSLLQQQITSQNKINELLEQSAQAIACGPTCQKEKTTEELKQKYLNAQVNVQNAPALLEEAKKNYYIYKDGRPAYNNMRESELKANADKISKELTNIFNDSVKSAITLNNSYNIALTNSKHTEELLYKLEKENSEIKKKLGTNYSDILTNDRKTYYEQLGINDLEAWYKLWFYIYYILVAVFIIALFLATSTMSKLTIVIITILLVLYPFYIYPVIMKIYNTIKSVSKLAPKNVYNNL